MSNTNLYLRQQKYIKVLSSLPTLIRSQLLSDLHINYRSNPIQSNPILYFLQQKHQINILTQQVFRIYIWSTYYRSIEGKTQIPDKQQRLLYNELKEDLNILVQLLFRSQVLHSVISPRKKYAKRLPRLLLYSQFKNSQVLYQKHSYHKYIYIFQTNSNFFYQNKQKQINKQTTRNIFHNIKIAYQAHTRQLSLIIIELIFLIYQVFIIKLQQLLLINKRKNYPNFEDFVYILRSLCTLPGYINILEISQQNQRQFKTLKQTLNRLYVLQTHKLLFSFRIL
eukprot:TRINITY_DN9293_c0_g2_i1.p1 TRINITY_DN9293_c0_g2~~TRINITY_DN9293_c0_g2_i1.p1  ORF type:complete len:281 (+),score=-31.30 TRINITY_DN9293_c0_g2_i1:338-1180(+)